MMPRDDDYVNNNLHVYMNARKSKNDKPMLGPTFQYKTHSDTIYRFIINMVNIINQHGNLVVVRFVFERPGFDSQPSQNKVFKLVLKSPFSKVRHIECSSSKTGWSVARIMWPGGVSYVCGVIFKWSTQAHYLKYVETNRWLNAC